MALKSRVPTQRPFDSALSSQTAQFLDELLSAVNQLVGRGNAPPASGIASLAPNTIDPTTDQIIAQGLRTGSITTPIVAIADAAGFVTFYWDGSNGSQPLRLYRDDNTIEGPFTGSLKVTGLTPGSTYYFYPYHDDTEQNTVIKSPHLVRVGLSWAEIPGVSVGTPAIAFTSKNPTALQQQFLRSHVPLSLRFADTGVTIPAAGPPVTQTGGNGGGAGGGGQGKFLDN